MSPVQIRLITLTTLQHQLQPLSYYNYSYLNQIGLRSSLRVMKNDINKPKINTFTKVEEVLFSLN